MMTSVGRTPVPPPAPRSSHYCHFCGRGNLEPTVKKVFFVPNGGKICDCCVRDAMEQIQAEERRQSALLNGGVPE